MLWRKYHSFDIKPDAGRRFFSVTPRSQSNHKLSSVASLCFIFYFAIVGKEPLRNSPKFT